MLAPFTTQRATSVDNGIGRECIRDCMMNVDENVDDHKYYAGTTCNILDPLNPPTP